MRALNRFTPFISRGWFCLDFMSLVPWELLALFSAGGSSSALRLPKLLKLLRLVKILKLVRASRVVGRIEQNIGMKNGVFRLLKVCCKLITSKNIMLSSFALLSFCHHAHAHLADCINSYAFSASHARLLASSVFCHDP